MAIYRLIFGTIGASLSAFGAVANASSMEEESRAITASDMAAFSRVLAEDPLGGSFPYNVRVVVYANPNQCFESFTCENAHLFLVVIGDGELPDYEVYDAGTAYSWEFVDWTEKPTRFYDDARDSFVIELRKSIPCDGTNCEGNSLREETVKARVSLYGFEWVE